ncbi:hypothetical protein AAEU32_13990 [Pseudoalteromonas sp. SSDWG2]|uniref:hypothetical protein n=1 Tax=Pseudoalteromonas sp. SSDWG2 TaxID=3139391 RepID=UPI003BA88015
MRVRSMLIALLRKRGPVKHFHAGRAISLLCVCALITSLTAYFLGATASWQRTQNLALAQVKTRIALDSQYIGLANPLLEVPADNSRTRTYIADLNELALSNNYPVIVEAIETGLTGKFDSERFIYLNQPGTEPIKVYYSLQAMPIGKGLSVIPILLALLLALLMWPWFRAMETKLTELSQPQQSEIEAKQLIIDLVDKSIRFGEHSQRVNLANKPLCFYLALLEFSVEHPQVMLNQNKDVPDELLQLAHKYFARLIELGHTIRKRPNFSNSLEKTLSEIRAALDESFANDMESKEPYFPPKAHGEGSRSRVHHYGLGVRDYSAFTIIGK